MFLTIYFYDGIKFRTAYTNIEDVIDDLEDWLKKNKKLKKMVEKKTIKTTGDGKK